MDGNSRNHQKEFLMQFAEQEGEEGNGGKCECLETSAFLLLKLNTYLELVNWYCPRDVNNAWRVTELVNGLWSIGLLKRLKKDPERDFGGVSFSTVCRKHGWGYERKLCSKYFTNTEIE